jgi:hypothetical protein
VTGAPGRRHVRLDGRFEFDVPPGEYILRASAPGLAQRETGRIAVGAGEKKEGLAIPLEPAR